MELNDEIRKLIMANEDAADHHRRRRAQRHAKSARRWLAQGAAGVTTVDEVMRVTSLMVAARLAVPRNVLQPLVTEME